MHKGPISSNSQFTSAHFATNENDFSLYNLNFCPNLSSQVPNFENFQFTRPPFQRQWSVRKPTLRKSGPHTATWKKCPPPPIQTEMVQLTILLCIMYSPATHYISLTQCVQLKFLCNKIWIIILFYIISFQIFLCVSGFVLLFLLQYWIVFDCTPIKHKKCPGKNPNKSEYRK